jgi:hypothetical protein
MKIAKVIPIFQKVLKIKLKSTGLLQPNQCNISNNFEKLVLEQITKKLPINLISLANNRWLQKPQPLLFCSVHNLISIQSIISYATNLNNSALMASLNLSATLDLLNVNLLLKRLSIIGLPMDLV